MVYPSFHSIKRGAQRNLSQHELEYVILYGHVLHRAGAVFYFLRNCDIPQGDLTNDQITRLVGTAVVISRDGRTVITTWRNRRDGLKKIKRKPKYGGHSGSPFSAMAYW